ncbi:MAG TPA: AAA family ATPase, partial [Chloroflexi bacterium]|nr:AAA family ATPase [Chloroflexota bacterium]
MGNSLKISLLGGLTIEKNRKPVTGLASRKAEALLAYLAYTERPYAREILADLLWDDRSQKQALGNLRVLLSSLRKQLKPYVVFTRQTAAFDLNSDYRLDTAELIERVAAAREGKTGAETLSDDAASELRQAVALYQGDFLDGFYLRESRGFEEWALLERERLRRLVIEALQSLVSHHLASRTYREGLDYAAQLLKLDPLREEAHRRMMRLLVRTGQRDAALQQYKSCRRLLNEELGVEPMLSTARLYHQIKAISSVGAHNLPPQPTPFVGREVELDKVSKALTRPDSRLLTLVGPGGIGKTRLAIEAASRCRSAFLRGVCFVPLSSLQSADLLAASIAGSLQLSLSGDRSAVEELLDALREREMLLVLDNFERLIDEGAGLLTDILQKAKEVRILVTSRERLNLRAERIFNVDGLPVPAKKDLAKAERYDAVQLFLQSARQLQSDFSPSAAEMRHIARICQLVEGMPLGIELAAAWTRTLSCREIAAEIEESLEFLSAQSRDIPERHRSLGAVFDQSWKRLSAEEQGVFRRLSVFRGSFERPAVRQVAGASLPSLSALMDKSFLRKIAAERYDIHEMLRQYANKKLAKNPQEKENVEALYSAYYANFLRQREESILGSQQQAALAETETEIDNIRAMWQWAVAHQALDVIALSLESLYLF